MAKKCYGDREDSCCYLKGVLCKYVRHEPDSERKWICTLREQLGSWEAVHENEDYKKDVKPILNELVMHDCGKYICENCRE